jgi:hypothetical protein
VTTDTDTDTEREFTAETWAYAGTRTDDDDKATHAWADPENGWKLRYWGGRGAYRVGGLYEVMISRDEGHAWRRGDPQPTGRTLEDAQLVAGWEVDSESARRRLARLSAERRAKRDGGVIDAACADLCALAAGMRSFDQVDRLTTSVKQRLYDAWHKGPAD